MPSVSGPRPDQIQQPAGTNIGDVLTATATGPAFQAPTGGGGGDGGVSTGPITRHVPIAIRIDSGGTGSIPPPDAGVAGDIPTSVYVNGEIRGEKLEFVVPEDYISGDLELLVTYRMTTAELGNLTLEAEVTVVDISTGAISVATGPIQIDFDPANNTSFARGTILSLAEGSFSSGDVIVVIIKRLGNEITTDTHSGDWHVVAYTYRYTGQIATRVSTEAVDFFLATDEDAPPNSTLGDVPTTDYPPSDSAEQKMSFVIPDNWDGSSDALFKITYAMSTAELGKAVELETGGTLISPTAGSLTPLAATTFYLYPPNDVGPHRSVAIRSINATDLNIGDVITLKVARRGGPTGGPDNHTGFLKLINVVMLLGQTSDVGVSTTTYEFLGNKVANLVSGAATNTLEAPTLSGDFQTWDLVSSGGGGEMHLSFEGKLTPDQSRITSIEIPIKGTGDYYLKIYSEDNITANPIYDSGLQTAPVSRTILSISSASITEQPTSEGRYFVVIEIVLGAGENIRVGRPYVRQD